MLRRWNSVLRARLGDDGVELRLLRRNRRGRRETVHTQIVKPVPAPAAVDEVIHALDQALGEMRERGHPVAGLRCDVVVGDVWMLYDVITAEIDDGPARVADDLVAAALADMAGARPGELVSRWLRQGPAHQFACALPASALRALQDLVQRHAVRLGSVQGELVRVFNANRHALSSKRSVLAVARPAGAQLGLIADGAIAAVCYEPGVSAAEPLLDRSRTLMRCAGFDPDPATRYCADASLALVDDLPWRGREPRPRGLRRLITKGRIARLDLDLSPTRPRVPRASWLLLAAGTLAIVLAGFQFQAANEERTRQARDLQRVELALNDASGGGRKIAPAKDARSALATAAIMRELQVPWPSLLGAFEAVAGRNVALLAVEPSASRQEVRLMAEARTSAAMLDYLDALRGQSMREVVLLSHQVQTQTPGAPIRFQARALWGAVAADRTASIALGELP